jgi:hypothetical protein
VSIRRLSCLCLCVSVIAVAGPPPALRNLLSDADFVRRDCQKAEAEQWAGDPERSGSGNGTCKDICGKQRWRARLTSLDAASQQSPEVKDAVQVLEACEADYTAAIEGLAQRIEQEKGAEDFVLNFRQSLSRSADFLYEIENSATGGTVSTLWPDELVELQPRLEALREIKKTCETQYSGANKAVFARDNAEDRPGSIHPDRACAILTTLDARYPAYVRARIKVKLTEGVTDSDRTKGLVSGTNLYPQKRATIFTGYVKDMRAAAKTANVQLAKADLEDLAAAQVKAFTDEFTALTNAPHDFEKATGTSPEFQKGLASLFKPAKASVVKARVFNTAWRVNTNELGKVLNRFIAGRVMVKVAGEKHCRTYSVNLLQYPRGQGFRPGEYEPVKFEGEHWVSRCD